MKNRDYKCYLKSDSALPMMYMPDCLAATMALLEAPRSSLTRCVYNVGAVSFTPAEIAETIRARHVPSFNVTYEPDPVRQAIADSWPASLDDSLARQDWKWRYAQCEISSRSVVFLCSRSLAAATVISMV